MRKILLTMILAFYSFWILPTSTNAQMEDGIYSLNYQVNKAGDISASIANDYFLKPAKLIVENGKMRVQLTIKNSAWVTEFTSPHGGNKKISEDPVADTRLVEFAITGIQNHTVIKMKVDIDEMNYHHVYSTDFIWDASSVKLIEAAKKPEPVKEQPKVAEEPKKEAVITETARTATKQVQTEAVAKVEEKVTETKLQKEKKEELPAEEIKTTEQKQEENKVATFTEETKETASVKDEKVNAASTQEAVEESKIEEKVEASVTTEGETLSAPLENERKTSNMWLYILGAVIVLGAAVLFARKKRSNGEV